MSCKNERFAVIIYKLIKLKELAKNTVGNETNQPLTMGTYYRNGYKMNENDFYWETEFSKFITDKNEIIPDPSNIDMVLTATNDNDWSWNKPKYVPAPSAADIGKVLTAVNEDPWSGYSWEVLDKTMKLPVVHDTAGFTELDNTTESGVYKYIADNGLDCILFVSEYNGSITLAGQKINGKAITQLLIKTTGAIDATNDNLGRGLIGPGVFIRTGIGNDQAGDFKFSWQKRNCTLQCGCK